jgi:hypothetical protein
MISRTVECEDFQKSRANDIKRPTPHITAFVLECDPEVARHSLTLGAVIDKYRHREGALPGIKRPATLNKTVRFAICAVPYSFQ